MIKMKGKKWFHPSNRSSMNKNQIFKISRNSLITGVLICIMSRAMMSMSLAFKIDGDHSVTKNYKRK